MKNDAPDQQMNPNLTGDFDTDVPVEIQNDVMERIVEAAWGFGSSDPEISIDDCEKLNALNIEFTGTIMIKGVEHNFHIRDGNNNGTEIMAWNEDTAIHREPPHISALVPMGNGASNAIYEGAISAARFLREWDRDLDPSTERGAILAKLPGAASYDAFFAPGAGTGRHHYDRAEKYGYQIGDLEDAILIRKKLVIGALAFRPHGDWPRATQAETRQTYADWMTLKEKDGPAGDLIDKIATRLSKTKGLSLTAEESNDLRKTGFTECDRHQEMSAWFDGLSSLISMTPIKDFDLKTLPEDPVKSLFHTLDPSLVADKRVNPAREVVKTLEAAFSKMARERSIDLPEYVEPSLARIGVALEELGRLDATEVEDPFEGNRSDPEPQ